MQAAELAGTDRGGTAAQKPLTLLCQTKAGLQNGNRKLKFPANVGVILMLLHHLHPTATLALAPDTDTLELHTALRCIHGSA